MDALTPRHARREPPSERCGRGRGGRTLPGLFRRFRLSAAPTTVGRGRPGRSREAQRTPRAPARARLSLLPSGPGEVHEDDATRGVWSHSRGIAPPSGHTPRYCFRHDAPPRARSAPAALLTRSTAGPIPAAQAHARRPLRCSGSESPSGSALRSVMSSPNSPADSTGTAPAAPSPRRVPPRFPARRPGRAQLGHRGLQRPRSPSAPISARSTSPGTAWPSRAVALFVCYLALAGGAVPPACLTRPRDSSSGWRWSAPGWAPTSSPTSPPWPGGGQHLDAGRPRPGAAAHRRRRHPAGHGRPDGRRSPPSSSPLVGLVLLVGITAGAGAGTSVCSVRCWRSARRSVTPSSRSPEAASRPASR